MNLTIPFAAPATVRFRYHNWRGEVANRTVTLLSLFFGVLPHHTEVTTTADGGGEQWYLVGWCHDRKAERYFAIKDITWTT